jgi:hypothetical protein
MMAISKLDLLIHYLLYQVKRLPSGRRRAAVAGPNALFVLRHLICWGRGVTDQLVVPAPERLTGRKLRFHRKQPRLNLDSYSEAASSRLSRIARTGVAGSPRSTKSAADRLGFNGRPPAQVGR